MRPLKIAFCSKLIHADFILAKRREGFHFISRWLYMGNLGKTQATPASHWLEENFQDIANSDYVIVYAEPWLPDADSGETLKTALVEAGWAMAHGRPVLVIGNHESYRPWRAASHRVTMLPSIEAALDYIKSKHTTKAELLACS